MHAIMYTWYYKLYCIQQLQTILHYYTIPSTFWSTDVFLPDFTLLARLTKHFQVSSQDTPKYSFKHIPLSNLYVCFQGYCYWGAST